MLNTPVSAPPQLPPQTSSTSSEQVGFLAPSATYNESSSYQSQQQQQQQKRFNGYEIPASISASSSASFSCGSQMNGRQQQQYSSHNDSVTQRSNNSNAYELIAPLSTSPKRFIVGDCVPTAASNLSPKQQQSSGCSPNVVVVVGGSGSTYSEPTPSSTAANAMFNNVLMSSNVNANFQQQKQTNLLFRFRLRTRPAFRHRCTRRIPPQSCRRFHPNHPFR